MLDRFLKFIKNLFVALKIIKNKRYRIVEGKEIVSEHQYKKDAVKKVKQLKKPLGDFFNSENSIVTMPASEVPKTAKKAPKNMRPTELPKKPKNESSKRATSKITFPTSWKGRGNSTIRIKYPKVFFPSNTPRNLEQAVNIYLGYKEHIPYWAEKELKEYGYTIKKVKAYITKNTPDPKIQWISRDQISAYTNMHPEKVNTAASQYGNMAGYWLPYPDAVRIVEKLQVRKVQEAKDRAKVRKIKAKLRKNPKFKSDRAKARAAFYKKG